MTIIDLGNAGLTVASLESVLGVLNLKGEATLKNVGHTDIMKLAMDLYNYAEQRAPILRPLSSG